MKPKLHCTSLFTTWEFPESPAIKCFPYPWQCPQPRAPVGVRVLLAKKMSHSPTAATIWACATGIWTSGQHSLLTSQWQPHLVNRQRDPCVRWTFTGPGGWRTDRRGTCRAFCDWVPASHKERMLVLAAPNSIRLCCVRQSRFSISAVTHLRPRLLPGPSFSHAVQAATVRTKSSFHRTLQCVAGGAINHKPISNFVMPYLIRPRSILSLDIHVFKHED